MTHEIPKVVIDKAHEICNGKPIFRGIYQGWEIYLIPPCLDKDGRPLPTGLPMAMLYKDGDTKFVSGIELFDLLDKLPDTRGGLGVD